MSVRGSRVVPSWTRDLVRVRGGVRLLDRLRPDALILDTPVVSDAARWVAAARRRGVPVISVHDAGIAPVPSDLAVDGSIAARGRIRGARQTLHGPRYAVIDRRAALSAASRRRDGGQIVVALGGGARAGVAARLSTAIAARLPRSRVVVAGGFLSAARTIAVANVAWLGPQDGLAHLLASADIAVVAGGVTLYESSAARVPAVPVAVVRAQVRTIRAFASSGAALDPKVTLSGSGIDARAVDRIVSAVAALASNKSRRDALGRAGRRLVDGRGADRVAAQVARVIARRRRPA
jgi:spore coat polysaccharide biosynthesis predicted glycosyltransferase SpsG